MFNDSELAACRRLVDLALEEDLDATGDLTSQAVIAEDLLGRGAFVARAHGVVAGLPAAAVVAAAVSGHLAFQPLVEDGAAVQPGDKLAAVSGSLRALLAAERTALNFLQRLSGVATQTRRFVDAVAGTRARILDTRKTTPGWRLLEKYAVRCGGGHNHRMGLYDGILIKDNHLAALAGRHQALGATVAAARTWVGGRFPIEVEIDSLDQLAEALACKPDIILLDNLAPPEMKEAVRRRDQEGPGVLLEASGGINLANIIAIAVTGVDRISVGSLTHSAPALDIALDYEST
jgi:nicotinate-nucleotide pyrophosphorylase (carboxylating)